MKVFVTRPIPENGLDMLKDKFEVYVGDDRILTKQELITQAKGYDGLVTLLTDKVDGEVLDGIGSQLKIVANYAVGFDNIDIEAAKQRTIFVTNTPGVLTEAVAEHTFALMLAVARHITEGDQFLRTGKYTKWEPMLLLGKQMWQKTIGIVGLGRIGTYVAKMATGFRMKILYHDITRNAEFETSYAATYKELGELLKESDVVSLHVPLIDSTRHLIGEEQLRMMKKDAILVNTARGQVIDEQALVKALKEKWIYGAGLDVFENEPHLAEGLAQLENVILTPHIGSATIEAREAMAEITAHNVIAALEGKTPPNLAK